MMIGVLLLVSLAATSPPTFAQRVQRAYAHQNPDTLRTLLAQADSQSDSLLVRYRLYPLTENATVLQDIPRRPDDDSARAWALLSGLWSYRAGEASIFSAVGYGRHSANLLETARARDPDDPYVLLVGGQSLLFRPAIAGKDPGKAAERFARLAQKAKQGAADGITVVEARTWEWLARREAGQTDRAQALYRTLQDTSLAPLYEQFLEDPPDV
ncbi:MAG: hypothetical protein ABEL97_01915 [Salinibacter sp.]